MQIDEKVSELRGLKALKEETENAIKSLERDVIEFMTEMEKPEYIGADYKVTYKPQTRKSLDKVKLSEVLDNLSEYEKVTTYNVLRVS